MVNRTDGKGQLIYHTYDAGNRLVKVTIKYTDKPYDQATGLYYFGFRYYDPSLGRFTTRDLLIGSFSKPQELNRYTYASNNPLKNIDPFGLFTAGGCSKPDEEIIIIIWDYGGVEGCKLEVRGIAKSEAYSITVEDTGEGLGITSSPGVKEASYSFTPPSTKASTSTTYDPSASSRTATDGFTDDSGNLPPDVQIYTSTKIAEPPPGPPIKEPDITEEKIGKVKEEEFRSQMDQALRVSIVLIGFGIGGILAPEPTGISKVAGVGLLIVGLAMFYRCIERMRERYGDEK